MSSAAVVEGAAHGVAALIGNARALRVFRTVAGKHPLYYSDRPYVTLVNRVFVRLRAKNGAEATRALQHWTNEKAWRQLE